MIDGSQIFKIKRQFECRKEKSKMQKKPGQSELANEVFLKLGGGSADKHSKTVHHKSFFLHIEKVL